ncbi:ribonuclease H-like protein [Dacryopinax primogenitus]|uniref:RNA exonuclease 4 n=1 Tax=Dacryopinax primogenitus (strain DJM 731) TaxID=1858805 RepID=M5FU40_DACPD|nr:ribonuclease H-like protein [Dacryopinax primogenitus]EJU01191.1 ribonuclease H-like protein [Dacryopinax primogenitus]
MTSRWMTALQSKVLGYLVNTYPHLLNLGRREEQTTQRSKDRLRKMIAGMSNHGPGDLSTRYVAIDCEMVGVKPRGASSLARVSIVDYEGRILLDRFVKQTKKVLDYRTKWSGVRPADLIGAPSFEEVQATAIQLLDKRIVVGHALPNDFRALRLSYPSQYTRDTQRYVPLLHRGVGKSLKRMIKEVFGMDIQAHEHDSVIDARASLALFRLYQSEWEKDLSFTHFIASSVGTNYSQESNGEDVTSPLSALQQDSRHVPLRDCGPSADISSQDGNETPVATSSSSDLVTCNAPNKILGDLAVYIIPAKLTADQFVELSRTIEGNGGRLTSQANAADVILTAVGSMKRLERHISIHAPRKAPIIRVEWLLESTNAQRRLPYRNFVAVPELVLRSM